MLLPFEKIYFIRSCWLAFFWSLAAGFMLLDGPLRVGLIPLKFRFEYFDSDQALSATLLQKHPAGTSLTDLEHTLFTAGAVLQERCENCLMTSPPLRVNSGEYFSRYHYKRRWYSGKGEQYLLVTYTPTYRIINIISSY